MTHKKQKNILVVPPDPFLATLKKYSDARLALGRSGAAMPTKAHLNFMLDHARARDAVWSELDTERLLVPIADLGPPVAVTKSMAESRDVYLRRPDLGRMLSEESRTCLANLDQDADFVIVVADGLSATAVNLNAVPLIMAIIPNLTASGFSNSGIVLVEQGRVAIGDEIAQILNARCVILLIGERPGLSAADSLGCYMTWKPITGTPDSQRNCVSNIRSGGLSINEAARKINWLMGEMVRLDASGVAIKDKSDNAAKHLSAD